MLMQSHHIESEEFRQELEADLIYLATFGLDDPIREHVGESIQLIRYGAVLGENIDRNKGVTNQVNIRMVTGDHLETALYVAKEVGIITEKESKIQGFFMTGDMFREAIGEYNKIWDETEKKYILEF